MQWIVWFLFTPFLLGTGYHALTTLPSARTSYPGEKAVAVIILIVVWGAFLGALLRLGRTVVWVHEDGIRYRGHGGDGFLRWESIAKYEFTRVVANGDAAIANALFDPGHLRRGRKFSRSGGGNNFVATVTGKDGRSVSVNAGFSRMRQYCETIVEKIDALLLPDMLSRVHAGKEVRLGDVVLDSQHLALAGLEPLPLVTITDLLVLDGQVWIDDGRKMHNIGAVPNAYALQATLRDVKSKRGATAV